MAELEKFCGKLILRQKKLKACHNSLPCSTGFKKLLSRYDLQILGTSVIMSVCLNNRIFAETIKSIGGSNLRTALRTNIGFSA